METSMLIGSATQAEVYYIVRILTCFIPLFPFCTPWKYQKTRGFLIFSGGVEREQWYEIGYCLVGKHPFRLKSLELFENFPYLGIIDIGLHLFLNCQFQAGFKSSPSNRYILGIL